MDPTTKICVVCSNELDISHFIGERSSAYTKTCRSCRDKYKRRDANRDKNRRNELARIAEKKPERIAVKKRWNEENYEKVAKKWLDSRQRKIEQTGVEEYLKQNAERSKKWRENNPEKAAMFSENRQCNKKSQYTIYKRSALIKGLDFEISFEQYCDIVSNPCYYCNVIQLRGFNGIDRIDQQKSYTVDNCVNSCKMCNYMKGSVDANTFFRRVEHILTYQTRITGNLYPECFADHTSATYPEYKMRATKKGIEFNLTREDYHGIISKPCYLCGKNADSKHTNGVDRCDNTKGYVTENVRPCCAECNYMKKDYVYDKLIEHMCLIYTNKRAPIDAIESCNTFILHNKNKKNRAELDEMYATNKTARQTALVERYNDEYRTARAIEAKHRRLGKIDPN
jgi:hypothetical protein